MLEIREEVLSQLTQAFLLSNCEQGFLLGCTTRLELLDCCCQIPAIQAGKYFYSPDAVIADKVIQKWAMEGVCFCGFIHSHIVEKNELSENDKCFAYELFKVYRLPVLWFGIGIVRNQKVRIEIYAVTQESGQSVISETPICFYER